MPNNNKSKSSNSQTSSTEKLKMEAANEVGVDLTEGYNLTTKEAGSVGGQMVKKMIDSYKNN